VRPAYSAVTDKVAAIANRFVTPGSEALRNFHSKNVGEPIEYSRCLPLLCFN